MAAGAWGAVYGAGIMSAAIAVLWAGFLAGTTLVLIRLNRQAAPACVVDPALKARAHPDTDGNGCG